ncbi:MAG: hypothetical protein KGD59_07815 [Candidatus Heimdallarchaeota archaeon]|nr:hypothetical protein [Candidatus Heimdallarchaeota archaeon]MBY8994442.1 hypothetical protein [Candidatus Heimdallarchaeota archaeon]
MTDNTDLLEEELSKSKIKPKTRHIVEQFVYLEATTMEKACQLEYLGLDLDIFESRIEYLLKNNLLLQPDTGENTYYLDYEAYQEFKERQDKRYFMIIVSIVIPSILFLLLGIAWIFTAT